MGFGHHVGLVKNPFGETAEEARHAAFRHLAAWRQDGGAGRQNLGQREKIGLVAARAMKR